jgi:adenylylsulfate kinase
LFAQGDFIEVYVKAPLSVCEQRDPKGLYKKARKHEIKDFTGISAPYEEPESPEVTINTHGETQQDSARHLLDYLDDRSYV